MFGYTSKSVVAFAALAAAVAAGGCSTSSDAATEGDVEIIATTRSALVTVTRVTVTFERTTPSSQTLTADLTLTNGQWKGTIGHIPVSTSADDDWKVTGKAYDASNNVVFQGSKSDVAITAGQTPAVALLLQPLSGSTPFSNNTPVVSSLYVSNTHPASGESVTITASASDPDTGTNLSWAFTKDDNAAFGNGDTASGTDNSVTSVTKTVHWSSSTTGSHTVTFSAHDQLSASAALSVSIDVEATNATGSATVSTSVNTWPIVDDISSTRGTLVVGDTNGKASTSLQADAEDADGDDLSYSWTVDTTAPTCTGHFSDDTAKNPTFTIDTIDNGATSCTVHVDITDSKSGTSRGGSNRGSLTLKVGADASVDAGPVIDWTQQDFTCAGTSQPVHLSVAAHDADGSVTITWSALKSGGQPIDLASLASSSSIAGGLTRSDLTITGGGGNAVLGSAGQFVITATVSQNGKSVTHDFSVNLMSVSLCD